MKTKTFLLKESERTLNEHRVGKESPLIVTDAGRAALSDGGKIAETAALKRRIKELESKNDELRDACSELSDKLEAEEIVNERLNEKLGNAVSAIEAEKAVSSNAEKARDEAVRLAEEAYEKGLLTGSKVSEEEIANLNRQIEKLRAAAVERADGLNSVRWFDRKYFRSEMFTAASYILLADLEFRKVVLKPAETGRGIECRNNTVEIPGILELKGFTGDSYLRAEAAPNGRITVFMED